MKRASGRRAPLAVLGLAWAVLWLSATPAAAQTTGPGAGWEAMLRDFRPGASLRLELEDGSLRWGEGMSADDSSLVLRTPAGDGQSRFARRGLRRVRLATGTREGLGIGVGALLGGGILGGYPALEGEGFSPAGLLVGATVGAGIGSFVGSRIPRHLEYAPKRGP